jgi:hypothetical protein
MKAWIVTKIAIFFACGLVFMWRAVYGKGGWTGVVAYALLSALCAARCRQLTRELLRKRQPKQEWQRADPGDGVCNPPPTGPRPLPPPAPPRKRYP